MRRLDFYTRSLVTDQGLALDFRTVRDDTSGMHALDNELLTSCCGGAGRFVLGDARGGCSLINATSLRVKRIDVFEESVAAVGIFDKVLVVASSSSQLKFFKFVEGEDAPKLVHKSTAAAVAWKRRGTFPAPISCIVVEGRHVAMGFKDGYVLWMTFTQSVLGNQSPNDGLHQFQNTGGGKVFSGGSISILSPSGDVEECSCVWLSPSAPTLSGWSTTGANIITPPSPITGVGFTNDSSPTLWVTTERSVSVYDEGGRQTLLDRNEGCKEGCACVGPDPSFFIVGKTDRVAFYTNEIPGACYSILGERKFMARCRDHIAMVSSGETWKDKLAAGQAGGLPPSSSKKPLTSYETFQIFDLQNKLVAHEFPLWRESDTVEFLAGDDVTGAFFVLTKLKRRLWRIQEKPVDLKLAEVMKRNLYSTAVALAKSSRCDAKFVADIYRRYGDHLYEKGNFDDAVAQYVQTVDYVEPSYVIRKFLDAPRVKNLVTYLETLHRVGTNGGAILKEPTPTAEHTTLLLTCYARLKEEEKIEALLQSKDARVDVEAALSVLKETGRIRQALDLAKSRGKDAWYVKTLLEFNEAKMAMDFIRSRDGISLFKVHGAALLKALPEESYECVQIWIERDVLKIEDALDSFAESPVALEALCRKAIDADRTPVPQPAVWNAYVELTLRRGNVEDTHEVLSNPRAQYDANFALAATRRFKFRKGELFLHEKAGRWDLLLQCKMDDGDSDESILALSKTWLSKDAEAWTNILRYFSSREPSTTRNNSIRDALRHIEQYDIVPPLLALRALSEKDNVSLGVARAYLVRQIQRSARLAESDEAEVKQLRDDTARMRHEIEVLKTEPKVFTATTCCMSGAPLELPVVHFRSGNSYNLSSLPASSSLDRYEDPKCAQDQNAVFDIARGLAKRRNDVDEEFFTELESTAQNGEAGFAFIAEYFSKCLFDEDDAEFVLDDEVE